jgi:hypothetical protein
MLKSTKAKRTIVWTDSDAIKAEKRLMQAVLISNDIETIPYKKPPIQNRKRIPYPFVMTVNGYTGLMPNGYMESFLFPFQTGKAAESGAPSHSDAIYKACRRINASGIPFCGQNYVYDLMWHLRYLLPVANFAYDSMMMFWAKWPELPKRLGFISSILLDDYQFWKAGRKSDDFLEYCDYALSDCEYTLRNVLILIDMMMVDQRMRQNWFRAHTRSVAGLAMSAKGMKANLDTIDELDVELSATAEAALTRCQYLVADSEFNPQSAPQKSELIYGLLGVRMRNAKGKYVSKIADASTGAVPLRAMRTDHPIFRRIANGILESIEPAKQLSNVVGIQFLDGRFLTAYDGTGTTTTRLSSRKSALGHGGNAQNIRKDYRKFMEADEDSFLLDIDYSGADDVFIAFESGEPKKIELVRSGRDIHCTNALIFFPNWTYDSLVQGKKDSDPRVVHPITGIRQITKKLVHGNHYLMAGLTLLMTAGREAIVAAAKELGNADAGIWNQDRLVKFCAALETKFRTHYPRFKRTGVNSWYNELTEELVRTGGISTIFGYYQRFLSDPHEDSTLRAAAATSGQANTAGRINMAMDELQFGIRLTRFRDGDASDSASRTLVVNERDHGVSLRLQTHDSFTFNVRHTNPNWREGVSRIFAVMTRPIICKGEEFRVGTEAEISYRWAGKESTRVFNSDDCQTFLDKLPRRALTLFDSEYKRIKAEKEARVLT